MLRLYLRRDRISLPLWVLLLSVPLATVYVGSIEKVYPTEAARAGFAASIMASPAQRALYGQVYNDSLGAVGIWKAGMFHVLIAVAVILTVIRHTRADEETGRTELMDSTAVGRYASLSAALMLSFGASIATGAIGAAGLLTTDVPRRRIAGVRGGAGRLRPGVHRGRRGDRAAVAEREVRPRRRVRRAGGRVHAARHRRCRLRPLSWLSPLGWSLQVRPYAGDHWWVLLLHLATAAVLTAVAYRLLAGRDVGAGLIAERAGPDRAAAAAEQRLRAGVAAGPRRAAAVDRGPVPVTAC